ncbi:WD40-repeat-containing domain protein [Protomyces lactucae-debilis]|uniref:WD40-repeat-containing domain protein n=1 Tax=Protomyces lactucae-debilis TaxID=2754530 RepID=A0A1Y2FSS2_PROLT|nr:WD40-repeat-containing domain protein [Protomyces lactucae-debilis]ORY87051.1 WD40-repeat-containing domain protein [Protomyces lactucae-debilis]
MDIHRARFVDYTPSTITAVAYSHPSSLGEHAPASLRCAVGRANGDIELWNPKDNWTHELTLKGGQRRSIEGLAWVVQKGYSPRLFSIGSSSSVTEWNLELLQPMANTDCNAGAIWSIAVSPDSSSLAVGCEDGSLVILDVSNGPGVVEYKFVLTRQKSRILSLAFSGANLIVGGCSDSTLKVWDCSQARGAIVARMSADKVRGEPTLVWSVLVLKNGNIVSGDSTGAVKIWDKRFYSLSQNFDLHAADVLCLGANEQGDTFFSAGVDRKMHMYKAVDGKKRWAHISGRRFHAHDVRAIATYEARGISQIVTGGVDMQFAILPLADFMKENHRMLPATPQRSHTCLARQARLLMLWQDRQVKVWRLGDQVDFDVELPQHQLVAKMNLRNVGNLSCGAISDDGRYLIVCTLTETKLYMLLPSASGALKPAKLIIDHLDNVGARSVVFAGDSSTFALTLPDSTIQVYRIQQGDVDAEDGLYDVDVSDPIEIETPDRTERSKKQQTYMKSVNLVILSEDGSLLAMSDYSGSVCIYSTDSGKLISSPPNIPGAITAMTFEGNENLVLTTASMGFHQFAVDSGRVTPWSALNSANLPKKLTVLLDHCLGIRIDMEKRAWMWGSAWVAFLNLNESLPAPPVPKRKQSDEEPGQDLVATKDSSLKGKFWITLKYRPLLHFDVMNEAELVVVERPVMDMLSEADIPAPFYAKRYGTG